MDFSQIGMLFNDTSVVAVQKTLNTHIRQNPAAQEQLYVMEGKKCGLVIRDLQLILVIDVVNSALALSVVALREGDLASYTALLDTSGIVLLKALLADDIRHVLTEESINVHGQVYMFTALHQVIKSLAIQWQQEIEALFGKLLVGGVIDYCKKLKQQVQEIYKAPTLPPRDIDPTSSRICQSIIYTATAVENKMADLRARCLIAQVAASKNP